MSRIRGWPYKGAIVWENEKVMEVPEDMEEVWDLWTWWITNGGTAERRASMRYVQSMRMAIKHGDNQSKIREDLQRDIEGMRAAQAEEESWS